MHWLPGYDVEGADLRFTALPRLLADGGEQNQGEATPDERHDHDHCDPCRSSHGRLLRLAAARWSIGLFDSGEAARQPEGTDCGPRKVA